MYFVLRDVFFITTNKSIGIVSGYEDGDPLPFAHNKLDNNEINVLEVKFDKAILFWDKLKTDEDY